MQIVVTASVDVLGLVEEQFELLSNLRGLNG